MNVRMDVRRCGLGICAAWCCVVVLCFARMLRSIQMAELSFWMLTNSPKRRVKRRESSSASFTSLPSYPPILLHIPSVCSVCCCRRVHCSLKVALNYFPHPPFSNFCFFSSLSLSLFHSPPHRAITLPICTVAHRILRVHSIPTYFLRNKTRCLH